MVGVHFGNSVHDNSNCDKICDHLTKKNSYLEQNAALFGRKNNNHKINPLIKSIVCRGGKFFKNQMDSKIITA